MGLISKEINKVVVYIKEKTIPNSYYDSIRKALQEEDFKLLKSYTPKIKFNFELNKYEFKIHLEASSDGSDYEHDVTAYFDSIQDILTFLGLNSRRINTNFET